MCKSRRGTNRGESEKFGYRDRGPECVSTTSMTGALMEVHSVCPRGSSLSTGLPTLTRRSTSQVKVSEILSHRAARRVVDRRWRRVAWPERNAIGLQLSSIQYVRAMRFKPAMSCMPLSPRLIDVCRWRWRRRGEMWGRTSSGRENGARFTAGHPYEVGGAAGPVPGPPQGERCASPNPT